MKSSVILAWERFIFPTVFKNLVTDAFTLCNNLCRVISGKSPSLKRIGVGTFCECGLEEIHIPDSVEELCRVCFYECKSLSRVTFGESSSLKRIDERAFSGTRLKEIRIPCSVEELLPNTFP